MSVKASSGRVHLCKEHYKQFKKETREDREVSRARFKRY